MNGIQETLEMQAMTVLMKNNLKKMERILGIQKIAEDGLTKNMENFWKLSNYSVKIGIKCTNTLVLAAALRLGLMLRSISINL